MISIDPTYHDYFGREVTVPPATMAVLAGTALDEPPAATLDPVHVIRQDAAAVRVPIQNAPDNDTIDWTLRLEDGTLRSGRSCIEAGEIFVAERLPLGYHRLAVGESATTLIVVPVRAWLPPELETGPGIWGFSLQLYSLRSRTDWGIGDFGALRTFAESAAAAGAQAIGLNPLHAPNVADPSAHSPYDPASRLCLSPLYIDVEAVEDFRESLRAQTAAQLLRPPREGSLVDYDAVTTAKLGVLERCYDWFLAHHRDDARGRAFSRFVEEGGAALEDYATFCAVAEHVRATTGIRGGWAAWPGEYRDPRADAVRALVRERSERIDFHRYLQWLADGQLARCAEACRDLVIGIYRDLAVGTAADGADSWSAPQTFVRGVSVGAPPDAVNALGQNWGLTPFHPEALRREAYGPFIALLRANMRHAGALRIDHVMAMQRLFWVPHGCPASEGAYVRYPLDDLLGIIALESVRHRCAVVGEDLGTVPEGFRERLAERGIFGCRLLFFEREADESFRPPQDYPPAALVSTGTHDLPSLPSWWAGTDIDLREHLGLLSPQQAADGRGERERGRDRLIEALRRWGDLAEEPTLEALVESAYRFLARSPARFLIVQMEDVLLRTDAVNVPGTLTEHPNWRRRLPLEVQEITRTALAGRLIAVLAGLRPAR
jgi:4-alpha-glucanotransferase